MKSYILTETQRQSIINCIFAAHHPGVSLATINDFVRQIQSLPEVPEVKNEAAEGVAC